MGALPEGLIGIGIKVAALIAILLAARAVYRWVASRGARNFEKEIRDAVSGGDLRRAGDLQVERGHLLEASRIYERAGEHARLAKTLRDLGNDKGAAEAFLKAGDPAGAAPLLRKLGDNLRAAECFERSASPASRMAAAECFLAAGETLRAARVYQDLEEFEKAADAFAKVDELAALDQALTMLENAALGAKDEARRKSLWRRAGDVASKLGAHARAARAFDEAGELARAASIYENALKQYDMAAAIYTELGDATQKERLTLPAGGALKVLECRESRARARGHKQDSELLGKELSELRSALTGAGVTAAGGAGRPGATALDPGLGARMDAGHGLTETSPQVAVGRAAADTRVASARKPQGSPGSGEPSGALPEGRFELIRELGRGGMGVVYLARDRTLDRLIALKFLPEHLDPASPMVQMFRREARSAAANSHPGIVTVFDVGTHEGREFIAMELVEGATLAALVADGPLPLPEAFEVFEKVLEAVTYAHGKGIIHRDLKPANLMRTKHGIKVMDFGLAKLMGAVRTAGMRTVLGGTPAYMPPEQALGQADHRSDIFALGATFYELLTGATPGDDATETPASIATSYPTPRQRVPTIPPRLSDLVMRCMEHDPALRPQDAATVLKELREIRAAALETRPAPQRDAGRAVPRSVTPAPAPAKPVARELPRSDPPKEPPSAAPRKEEPRRRPAGGAVVDVVELRSGRGKER